MDTTVIRVPTAILPVIRAIVAAYRQQESSEIAAAQVRAATTIAQQFLGTIPEGVEAA